MIEPTHPTFTPGSLPGPSPTPGVVYPGGSSPAQPVAPQIGDPSLPVPIPQVQSAAPGFNPGTTLAPSSMQAPPQLQVTPSQASAMLRPGGILRQGNLKYLAIGAVVFYFVFMK